MEAREHLKQHLASFRAEVTSAGLTDLFTETWFQGVQEQINAWDRVSIFTMHRQTLFISYVQSLGGEPSLIEEICQVRDRLGASPKTAVVRNRLKALAGDTANAIGALFELRSLVPLITPPNELVEFQPKFPGSQSKAEALVRIAGHESYVEATIFTKSDPSTAASGAFWFDPGEQQVREGVALACKITEEASQCDDADRPVVAFVAEGLVTTGLTLDRDPRSWAMSEVARRGSAPSLSAILFSKDIYCTSMELVRNANARHPLAPDVWDWLQEKCAEGWRP
jgi:hypothetical protein